MNASNFSLWITIIGALAALIAAIATCIYTIYTYKILKANNAVLEKSNKLAEYNVYIDFDKKFSEQQTQELIKGCRLGLISINQSPEIISSTKNVSGEFIQKKLFDIIEDLSKFYQDGLITLESVDSGFGYIVLYTGHYSEVRNHIKKLREQNMKLYKGFEHLYLNLLDYEPKMKEVFNNKPFAD